LYIPAAVVGAFDGLFVGFSVFVVDGIGLLVGDPVGFAVDINGVGFSVGDLVGFVVGFSVVVGAFDGLCVGFSVAVNNSICDMVRVHIYILYMV